MRSNSPRAATFQDWIEDDVLPTIRKTGKYELPQTCSTVPPQPVLAAPTIDEISQIIDLTLGQTDLDRKLIAGVKLNAIAKQHPQYSMITETAKSALSIPVENEFLSATELGKLMNPHKSAQAVNKLLIEQGFQVRNPEGSPEYSATEKGKPHSQLTLATAKGRDKTVQHLRWFRSVLEVIELEAP